MLTLQAQSLDWALAHVTTFGDTDVFPRPFEFHAIEHDWAHLRDVLSTEDILRWTVRPHRTLLAPKARYGFRVITQLDPFDALIFLAVVREIGEDLEAARVPVARDVVFSYRFRPDVTGRMFDKEVGYGGFQELSREFVERDPDVLYVGTADIADFYSRIYHHRLENALRVATTKDNHVKAVARLLSGWNGTETFGIPVGSAASRLLAEVTIADVDEALLANSARFIRYNDDYRFFGETHAEVYRQIAFLADILFRNHGLTLQPQKTRVVDWQVFRDRFLPSEEEREIDSLQSRFRELLAELDITDWYQEIDYNDLDDDQKELIDSMNLVEVFREQVESDGEPDVQILRFVLRRLAQLGDRGLIDLIFENVDSIYPVLPDIVEYLKAIRGLSDEERHRIAGRLLDLLNDSIVSELDYHRLWILDPFTYSREWDHEGRFFGIYSGARDHFTRRKAILAMGRSTQRHWFQSQWRTLFDEPAWSRRAVIAGASCLGADARRHWYRAVEPRLDLLERTIAKWAQAHPFT